MINPASVAEFLARKLADSNRTKVLPEEVLDAHLAALDPPPTFVTTPRQCQKATFLLCVKYPGYANWLEQGLGKTWIMLNLAAYLARRDGARTLVLVPYGSQLEEWTDREAPKHRPDIVVRAVDGAPEARFNIFWNVEATVIVVTYAAFLSFVCDRVETEEETKRKMVFDVKRLKQLLLRFQVIVADESANQLGSHQSLTFKTLKKLRDLGLARFYPLSGTPFGNDPGALWSQMYLVDRGETLGPTLGIFRGAYFSTKPNFWGGFKHTFKKGMTEHLHRTLAHRSIRYTADEVEDLPPLTGGITSGTGLMLRGTSIHAETLAYYEQIVKELKAVHGKYVETENAWHRLRRISSGYLLPKDDAGEEHPLVFPINPKLDLLLELLAEVDPARQVIVFCTYRYTVTLLVEALRKAKFKVSSLSGSGGKAGQKSVADFIAGRTRILVANSAGMYGLNLQCANIVIFFETPAGPQDRRQAEKRIHRGDQALPCFVWDLIVKGTADLKILRALEAGQDIFKEVLSGRFLV